MFGRNERCGNAAVRESQCRDVRRCLGLIQAIRPSAAHAICAMAGGLTSVEVEEGRPWTVGT
eukprot:2009750-Pyramimonas_sp.AAC.1